MKLTPAVRLFLLGLLTLVLELALIRYLPGVVWNLGYFPNLVLIAVFVGLGVGFVFHERLGEGGGDWASFGSALLLPVLLGLVAELSPGVPGFGRWAGDLGGDLYFTEAPKGAEAGSGPWLFVVWFSLIVALFAAIGQRTARAFAELPPLTAYTLDIAGSCTGILLLMGASALELPAWSWFLAAVPIQVVALAPTPGAGGPRWRTPVMVLGLLAGVLSVAGVDATESDIRWSPYQRVEYATSDELPHRIYVNRIPHQRMFDKRGLDGSFYRLPYQPEVVPGVPGAVLILGAGSGNDVQAALDAGATHVDAVEIDPVIADLGRRHHPGQPYSDPRVNLVIDDGRAFLARTERKYGRVVFALTDSLVKVSAMTQLRLENYLFTVESVRTAYGALQPGGALVLYNFYRRPWLRQKIERLLEEGTGRRPTEAFRKQNFAVLTVTADSPAAPDRPAAVPGVQDHEPPTDDWPFLYLERRGLPAIYAAAMLGLALILAMGLALLHRAPGARSAALSGRAGLRLKLAFFLMGVAFLLLETKSVIQFSLLFGTTWLNASLVFLGVLLLVLAANWLATLLPPGRRTLQITGAVLLAACAIPLAIPLADLATIASPALRFAAAAPLTFAPIFAANLLFSLVFREQEVAEHLFGWNILGATLGGLLEYAGMATGYGALALVVLACYTLALACLTGISGTPLAADGQAAAT